MTKHNFKIGDKVRLKNSKQFRFGAVTLTITKIINNYQFIYVIYEGISKRGYSYFPLKPCEVEPVVRIGEQLLFSFMQEK